MPGMRKSFAMAVLTLILLGACSAPTPSATPIPGLVDRASAVAAAEFVTTIAGPWVVGEVSTGTYAELWRGSTNDPFGQGTARSEALGPRLVWRVDLSGPNGMEELYLDQATGQLLDSITQGN
jgi:hypothetical protein